VWTFFHGLETGCKKTNQVEQGILHPLHVLVICCCIRRRSRTQSPLPKLQTGNNLLTRTKKMGHPQPPTPINCNNSTVVGIANNTVKWQHSQSMEMRIFWVADAVAQGKFDIKYFPGKENLADYQSKHHTGAHNVEVRPWYLQEPTSVQEVSRAYN
jgi:hypothetical protein